MNKLWHVARYEFEKRVFTRSFLILLLLMPVMLVIILGVSAIANLTKYNYDPIGYVDHAGVLGDEPLSAPLRIDSGAQETVPMQAFAIESLAQIALDAGQIQAFYVIPEGYPEDNDVALVYHKYPSDNATAQFWDFLQINLLPDQPLEISQRAVAGNNMVARTPDGTREYSENNELSNFLPLLGGIVFLILIVISSGYLIEAVSKEKENRTIEVLVTSVSPFQLIGGKVIGISAMVFVQFALWIGATVLAFYVGGHYMGLESLRHLSLTPFAVLTMTALLIPTYILLSAIMIMLGAVLVDSQETNAVGPLILMLFEFPYLISITFVDNPSNPMSIFLSLFPFSALQTISMRLALTTIPLWQIAASIVILCLTAAGFTWLAARAFRLGMLRFGQRLSFRMLFSRKAEADMIVEGRAR
jgi:ABC-2 type transport system permease protein